MTKHKLYHAPTKTAKLKRAMWKATGDMADEINTLIKLLSFYVAKVQLVSTTFKM